MPPDPGSTDPPRRPFLRPWWRWNFVTLGGVLFATVWVRELLQLSPGRTWLVAATILAVWYVGPCLASGERPWPFSALRWDPRAASSGTPVRAGSWCKRFAVVIAVLAVIATAIDVTSWVVMAAWRGFPGALLVSYRFWEFILDGALTLLQRLGLAVGLWTIGSMAQLVLLADADRTSRSDGP